MASLQSEVLAAPGDLSRRLQEARIFLGNHPEHTEPGWHLFALMPTVVEFWQGTPFWGMLFLAAGLYAGWMLFFNRSPD